jgi:hypothetical protein
MANVTYNRVIKAAILLILLVVFFVLFFWQVVIQYSEELTNTAKTAKKAKKIEMPTFTICSGFKKSLLKKYNISLMIFNMPPGNDTDLPSNITLRNLFDDLTFKLNTDFVIGLSPQMSEPILLNIGKNEIKTEDSIYKFEVKEFPTHLSGMCYTIFPIGVSMQPDEETMLIYIARNNTLNTEEMTKVVIQISSNDTYNTIVYNVNGMKNKIIEGDFTSNLGGTAIYYTEENTEFIKDCSDSSYFKCMAEKYVETEKFDCAKKCIPLIYDSLMDVINHTIPKCTDPIEKDEYCINGMKGMGIINELKSTCMKQCKNKGITLETTEYKQSPLFPIGKDMDALK